MFGLFRSIMDRHRKDKKCKRRGRKRHSPLGKGRSLWPRLCFELLEERELLAITVNSLLDSSAIDLTTGWTDTIGTITLRSAVESAVNLGGNQTIDFNITVTGPFIIQPGSALPTLSEDSITIDATTQSGIIDDGASAVGTTHGFVIAAADCAIKGLTIQNFSGAGIKIAGAGSDELVLDIPTFTLQFDAYTPAALTTVNGAAAGTGLGTLNSAHGNTIEENNILNNGLHGILISHASVNTIIDNTISGTTAGPGIEIIGDDDVLVVSDGADSLNAGAGEDLIVTGWLSDEMYGDEDNPGVLQAYYEWLQSGSVQQRMDRL